MLCSPNQFCKITQHQTKQIATVTFFTNNNTVIVLKNVFMVKLKGGGSGTKINFKVQCGESGQTLFFKLLLK